MAASQGHKSTCKCLLDAKADPTLRDLWGKTPAEEAARTGHGSTLASVLGGPTDLAGAFAG